MEPAQEQAQPSSPTPRPASVTQPIASSKTKADLGKRFIAQLIDAAVAFVVGLVPYIGGLAGAAYFVVRDGLEIEFMDRRSLGKKIMKLRPVRDDGKPMDIETSVRRNWMWGIGAITSLLLYIPIIGWLLIPVVGLIAAAIGLFEIYKVLTDPEGRRWGDNLAKTKVIEVPE